MSVAWCQCDCYGCGCGCDDVVLRGVALCTPVYNDGQICLDILQNNWSPIYDVVAILSSLQVRSCASPCFFPPPVVA